MLQKECGANPEGAEDTYYTYYSERLKEYMGEMS